MAKVNPVVHGRMYKVSDGGPIKGVRFNENNTVSVLVVPAGKKRNAGKKRWKKAKANRLHRKPKRGNPYFNISGTTIRARSAQAALKKALKQNRHRRRNVAAGYMDEEGIFHPIRASFDYSKKRAGEAKRKSSARARTKPNRSRTRRKAGNKKRRTALRRIR